MAFVGTGQEPVATKRPSKHKLLHSYFERQARRVPHRTAVECAGDTLTYLELDRYSNQVAHALLQRGITTGSLVAIYLPKSPRLFATILGILKAGAAYVPLDSKFPAERIATILDDCKAAAIVSERPAADGICDQVTRPFLMLDGDAAFISAQPTKSLSPRELGLSSSHLCYVIYTSGSTGRPKGVMIEHRNAAAFIEGMREAYEVGGRERIYQGFSVAFDASVEEIWLAFSLGATLVVPSEEIARSPADAAEFIHANRVTYFSTIPTFLSMIDQELPTVRTLVLGGEACTPELIARWAQPWRRMLNTYGPTEATVVATLTECSRGQPVTIGRPLPGYRVYVLDESLQAVAPGEVGELFIGGSAIARGYMNSPDLTDERFFQNPLHAQVDRIYRTSDQVRLLPSGELQFVGRIDGQIKIRGFRVELSEIESVLMRQPGIRAAAVNVISSTQVMELAAFVVCDEPNHLDRESIANMLRQRLPEYMVPKYLDPVAELPLTTSGKIDRRCLPAPVALLKGDTSDREAPSEALEMIIAEAWESALNVRRVSVSDDFFVDLGGHSLLAARAVTLLRKCLGGETLVSVRDLYRHRTVRDLANALRRRGVSVGKSEAPPNLGSADMSAPSEHAFASVSPITRWTVVFLQAVSVLAFYGLASAPIAYTVLMTLAVLEGRVEWTQAAWISTTVGFAIWPSMLALTVGLKWLVIGRYRPGRYPVWGFYYFRWWFVARFQALGWTDMFSGTPLMSLYYRAMGAKVGRRVTLSTGHCVAFDMLSIGHDSSVGLETQLLGYRVEDGMLIIAPIAIGRNCFIGMHCNLGLDTCMQDGARLDDMSLLQDGTALRESETRRGNPAMPADVEVPAPPAGKKKRRSFLFGAIHIVLIYLMGYFLLATIIPSIALIAAGLFFGGVWYGIGGALLSVPLSIFSYLVGVVVLKRIFIGRLGSGTMRLDSIGYLRHWFEKYLMENTRQILMPLYATVYLPRFLRLLGAKIGTGTEISTVAHISPDQLEIGDGSFLADACLVGGNRIHAGQLETAPVRIGAKSFIGNSALIPSGTNVGNNVLIGVASTPEAHVVLDDTSWLGSPAFPLPRTQKDSCFPETTTFNPSAKAKRQRAFIDAARLFVPGLIIMANLIAFTTLLVLAWHRLPLWGVIAAIPLVDLALSFNAIIIVALIKKACLGTFVPMMRPLWSKFVWLNEFVNAAYEGVAAPVMTPLMGTPFIAPCLRMMGCRIGKWTFLETTLFSEFDLVRIGDYAALNLGSTVQTHLFEDRIFKADSLSMGKGCSVGNMAIVLYGTEMHNGSSLGPLSVLMKGETLPARTRWSGIPCEQVEEYSIDAPPPLPSAVAHYGVWRSPTESAGGGASGRPSSRT